MKNPHNCFNDLKKKKVLVIGDIMVDAYDFCYSSASRPSPEKEGTKVTDAANEFSMLLPSAQELRSDPKKRLMPMREVASRKSSRKTDMQIQNAGLTSTFQLGNLVIESGTKSEKKHAVFVVLLLTRSIDAQFELCFSRKCNTEENSRRYCS